MSEIGIDKFTDDELVLLENAYGTSSHGQEIKRVVAEIRRLRAENKELKKVRDKAMAIGGINFCAACGDEPVLEEKTFCDNCRSDIGQSELAS